MIRSYLQIIGTSVVREEDGEVLALIRDIIIHPDTGKIEGFWVKPMTIPVGNAVIKSDSILEWKKNIYVRDENEIAEAEDIIKITEILERDTFFIGNLVKNEAGDNLGRTYDADFDTEKLFLQNIYTQKLFLLFKYNQRIFNYNSIIKVLPDYILVKDTGKIKEPAIIEEKQPLLDV